MKEFNLSEFELIDEKGIKVFIKENVKEFIKRLKEYIKNKKPHGDRNLSPFYEINELIDKLAGDKLVEAKGE